MSVGLVRADGRIIGTCFRYRSADCVLTAAHVVAGREVERITVEFPGRAEVCRLLSLALHTRADVAVCRIEVRADHERHAPVLLGTKTPSAGEPFQACGFDELDIAERPVPRVYLSNVLRPIDYSMGGHTYAALETAMASPRGLSGAPMTQWTAPSVVVGMMVSNVVTQSASAEGDLFPAVVTTYGVAVDLRPLRGWLADHVPALTDAQRKSLEHYGRDLGD